MLSKWRTLSAAPHRLLFFGGLLQLIMTIAWWSIELAGRYTDWWPPLPTVIPSGWAHAILMLYGLFPFFIFGFLMTTYPRWMRGQEIPYHRYVTTFILLMAAIVTIYIALHVSKILLIIGISILLLGWSYGFYSLLQVYFQAPTNDKYYETVLNIILLVTCLNIVTIILGLIIDNPLYLNSSIILGIWLYLIPLLITVCHRMLPFFTSCVLSNYTVVQPKWTLPVVGICVVGHSFLELQNYLAWRFIFDIPLMLIVFHHSYYWAFRRSFADRLLAVLHVSFLWLGIALLLYNIQSITLLFSHQLILGKAPLHALTIGFITSLVVGMASRVMRGHSGRPLIADNLTWICFWSVSGIALLRISAELPIHQIFGLHFNLLASLLWLLFLSLWSLFYLPMVIKPRVDGKPG